MSIHFLTFNGYEFEFRLNIIQLFFIMGRQPKKCPKKCTHHLFSLKPVHYSAFFSRQSQFSYCPQNSKSEPNIPKFNRDRKSYTAAFILAKDQITFQENDKIYQIEHERFKQSNYEQKSQILIPKPRSKSCFCNICKEVYEDYRQHISSQKHHQRVKQCEFNADILKLCQKFGNHLQRASKIIHPQEIFTSFTDKLSQQTICSNSNNFFFENEKEKPSIEEPELFLQRCTKENLDAMSFCRSLKSFHTFGDVNVNNVDENEVNFLNYNIGTLRNKNKFPTQCGSFKLVDQTTSPVKAKFDRPIILLNKTFTFDE